jgi:hypothetical protein
MTTSPIKPLLKSLKNLSFLIGHLFDIEKLKASKGIVFERGRFTTLKVMVLFLAAFGVYIMTPCYIFLTNLRYLSIFS